MAATRACSGAAMPPASAAPTSRAPNRRARADQNDAAPQAWSGASAVIVRLLHQGKQRRRQLSLDGHQKGQQAIVAEGHEKGGVRWLAHGAGRRLPGGEEVGARCFGPRRREHPCGAQERYLGSGFVLQLPSRVVIDGFAHDEEANGIRCQHGEGDNLHELTVHLADGHSWFFGFYRLRQRWQLGDLALRVVRVT